MGFPHSPIEIDRALARAAGQWAGWRQRLRAEPGREDDDDDVLAQFRPVTGSSLFRELGELPEHDPLREPLQRWVYRLAEQRIDADTLTRLERERRRKREIAEAPGRAAVSIARLLAGCLEDGPRSEHWLRLFIEHAPPVSAISIELWQRRREIARRMGLSSPAQIESALQLPAPGEEAAPAPSPIVLPAPAAAAADPGEAAVALARTLSEALRDRLRELAPSSPAALIDRALGRDIPGAWPGRLSAQRLSDFFRGGDLLRSLDLRLEPLPAAVGAASFCRALGVLGAAWFEALAPADQPFVVAHDPYGAGRHQAASLFALLPLNAKFLSRHLELPRAALPDAQRRLAQLWLVDLAQAALRVRLRPYALASERAFREAFSELVNQELQVSLPPTLAGALFQLDVEDEQRLLGRLLAAERERELTEAHDEDWFRNPRAIEQLRAEAHRPPAVRVELERARAALAHGVRRLNQLLR
ncbi:MAG TPA: hypothetical protein VFS67_06975 [Polyangiaceae bacterium]|nr:hypothetical protein [Polyangiaceae bacterium]